MRDRPSRSGNGGDVVPLIVACVCPTDRARLRDAFRGSAEFLFVGRLRDLVSTVARETRPVTAVLVAARDSDGTQAAPVVRSLAPQHPRIAIVAYCDVGVPHSEDLRYLAAAGVHEFVFRGVNDAGAALRTLLESAIHECAADVVMRCLAPHLPQRLHPFAEVCLSRPREARTVTMAAQLLGMHRKTLVNHCTRETVPGPQELLGWFRLMLAGYFLETTGRTVESIALAHEWASVTSLRNMFRRYMRTRATDVRRSGGLALVVEHFRRRIDEERLGGGVPVPPSATARTPPPQAVSGR